MPATPLHILQSIFGYAHFRGHQQAIVEHVAEGGDALVLMPTGGGKSLCYQIPALLRQGTGIVVSPLIALMHDQVDADAGPSQFRQEGADQHHADAVDEIGHVILKDERRRVPSRGACIPGRPCPDCPDALHLRVPFVQAADSVALDHLH